MKVADCVADAAAAAAWVVEHIADYGGDPRLIFVAGHSAGGYLTSMIGLDKRWLAPYGIDPDEAFAALIPYSGQAVTHFARRRELGLPDTQPLVDDMAPLYHVRPDAPPMLILLGRPRAGDAGPLRGERLFLAHDAHSGTSRRTDPRVRRLRPRQHAEAGHYMAVRYIRERVKALQGR